MKCFALFLASLALALPVANAQSPGSARLTVEIVPESSTIAPGKPFTVAVKMTHIEHGHSYWKHPGGPGLATKFKWTLPEGFTADAPQWPVPSKEIAASFVGYLYSGEILPLVTLHAPASIKAGDQIKLDMTLSGLVCIDSCLPVRVPVSTTLTVADTPGTPDAATQALFAKARQALPIAPKSWTLTAQKTGNDFAIVLKPEAGANTHLTKAYFFSSARAWPAKDIDPEKPQELKKVGDHWQLSLSPFEGTPPTDALIGVLATEDGWLESDPKVKGFEINLPITDGHATATQPAPEPSKEPKAADAPKVEPKAGEAKAPETKAPITNGMGTVQLLLFAFLGGLILNVMPCVFPVLGIKIMGFVEQAGDDRRKVVMHGLAYTAGVLVCFWVLALLVILLGKGWGAQLQSPLFILLLCYFFMAFGLNMAGVFEVGTSATGVGHGLQSQGGLQGSFFSGLLATVVATPCSAPFLAPALTWAISLPALLALLVFTVIGLGLSSPYLVLSLAPGLIKLLPRPGAWMESFKQGMSFLLFGTSGYMLWVIGGMVSAEHVLQITFGLVLVAVACWIWGRWVLPHKPHQIQRRGMIFSILALAIGLLIGWPPSRGDELKWQEWSPEIVQQLRTEGKPVYIDFTARWCTTCQVNHSVYSSEALKALFRIHKVVLLKADYTNFDDRITQTLRTEYQAEAIPVNVLYIPGEKQHVMLPQNLTVATVTEALKKLEKKP